MVGKTFEPFIYDVCAIGIVNLAPGVNRKREYSPGVFQKIPDNYLMSTCNNCGETYISLKRAEELDDIVKETKCD
jgi:hypothetical protein